MKDVLLSLAFISFTCLAFAQEKGIKFQELTWQEVKAKAKAENKFIFMDVFATWCGPCKSMDMYTYPSEKAGVFMNDKFVSIKVQADRTEADNEFIKSWYADAARIVKNYRIGGFPTLLFFSPDGKLVNRCVGLRYEGDLIKIAQESLEPSTQFYTRVEKYQNGRLVRSEKPEMAILAKSIGEKKIAQDIADDYINNYLLKLKEDELYTKDNLVFISRFLRDSNSRAFKLFTKEADKINAVLGYYQAEYAIMNLIDGKHLPQPDAWATTTPDWDALEKSMTEQYGRLGTETVYAQRMSYYCDTKKWPEYGIWYVRYLQKAYTHPRYVVNDLSWTLFENVEDLTALRFACDVVMKYALEEWYQNDPACYDTYANLLYKTGRKEQAIDWEEKAAKLSGNEKIFVETIEKMKKGIKTWKN